MITEEKPEAAGGQWPDSLLFWVIVTFGTIATSALLCAGGLRLIRWFMIGSQG